MSSSSKDQKDRVWDAASRQNLRRDPSTGYWYDESGRRVSAPQRTQDVTSSTATSSTRGTGSAAQAVPITSRGQNVRETTDQMRSMNLGSPPTQATSSGKQPAGSRNPGSSSTTDQRAALQSTLPQSSVGRGTTYATTSSDPRTGLQAMQQGSGGRSTGYAATGLDGRTATQNITQSAGARIPANPTTSTDPRTTTQAPAPGAGAGIRNTAPYTATVSDQRTGLQTRWEVSETTPYRDPDNTGSNRGLNVKRIRQVGGNRDGQSQTPAKDYKTYRVIEVALVPPEDVETSNVSRITPTGAGVVRNRRFVIVREFPERNSFEALAIKTYNGRGVGAPGVIKSHHSIIYTNPAPSPLANELPGRTPRGDLENGMQPQAIRVKAYDRGKALDPLSRLDYADRYEFDWGVPNISFFGRVHEESHAALFVQYNYVWQTIRTAVQGHIAGLTSTTTSSGTTGTGLTARTGAATGATAGTSNNQAASSTGATQGSSRPAGSTTSANAATNARLLVRHYAQRDSGPCTEQQMSIIIWYLQEYARRKGHPRPGLTAQQVQDYASNGGRRAAWIQNIWAQWGEAQESSDEESEEEDSDE